MTKNSPRDRKSLKESLRDFVPAWHTVVMGTGAVNGLVSNFPFFPPGMGRSAVIVATFFLTLMVFVVISFATILRYVFFKKLFHCTLRNPEGLFLGAAYMGVTTILNGALSIYHAMGWDSPPIIYTLWGIWWLNSALSSVTATQMLYLIIRNHPCSLEGISPVYMMPFLPLVIASSTGGLFAVVLRPISPKHAIITIEASITTLCIAMALVFLIMIASSFRLIMFGTPKPDSVLTINIPLGPLGQGALGFMYNGKTFMDLSSQSSTSSSGQTVYTLCICVAWMLWALSLAWAVTILCVLFSIGISHIPFNLGFWGTIFPNAATALCSIELGAILQNDFLTYFGSVWSVFVVILWCYAIRMTVPAIWNTTIFKAPGIDQCLTEKENGSIVSSLSRGKLDSMV